jgi:hypothetical protein
VKRAISFAMEGMTKVALVAGFVWAATTLLLIVRRGQQGKVGLHLIAWGIAMSLTLVTLALVAVTPGK